MSFTRNFTEQYPPKRYDGTGFKYANLRECATEGGAYSTIEQFVLIPGDADPANPQVRNFTTHDSALGGGYAIVQWEDADGVTVDSQPVPFGTVLTELQVSLVRGKTGVSTTEYALDGTDYWTDEQIQDVIERHTDADGTADLDGAASEILEAWEAQLVRSYDVTMDGQSLKRSQQVAAVRKRADLLEDESVSGSATSVETGAPY